MTAERPPLIGVLLAAGRSNRMGRLKQALPWPPADPTTTVIAASFDVLCPFCTAMVVALGHEPAAVRAALGSRTFREVTTAADAPMSESARTGIIAVLATDARADILLHPADHPAVVASTIRAVLDHAGSGVAVMPEHGGKGGHPVFIPNILARRLVRESLPEGLRGFWARNPTLRFRIPTDDAGAVFDLDQPEDYDRARSTR